MPKLCVFMPNDISKKIKEDLEKVGFPAEVAVSSDLEKEDWIVYNGALFEDDNEDKTREIDVHAVSVDFAFSDSVKNKPRLGNENKLISHLIIEVKKSEKPWIFFDNARPNWPQIPIQNFKSKEKDIPNMFDDLTELGLKSHRYLKTKLHKSYHVAFTKPSEPSMIFEALVKASKALNFFKKHYGIGGYSLHLFTPVVVFDGNLWSATLDKKGKVKLKKADHLFVLFGQLTKDENEKIAYEEDQICDVVTREAFMEYLGIIKSDNKEVYKAWTTFINSKP